MLKLRLLVACGLEKSLRLLLGRAVTTWNTFKGCSKDYINGLHWNADEETHTDTFDVFGRNYSKSKSIEQETTIQSQSIKCNCHSIQPIESKRRQRNSFLLGFSTELNRFLARNYNS